MDPMKTVVPKACGSKENHSTKIRGSNENRSTKIMCALKANGPNENRGTKRMWIQ